MTSNLVAFLIITFVTIKTSLHERHNDELYAEKGEVQPKNFLDNKKFLSRRFIDEPESVLKPMNQPHEKSLGRKLEDILILLKRLLLQGSHFAKSLSEQISIKDTEKRTKKCDTKKIKKTYFDEISTEE